MRTLFVTTAAFAALMLGVPIGNAHAETIGETMIVLDATATHGSIVCNSNWLDRPGGTIILNEARAAHVSKQVKDALITRGMADFDKSVRDLGMPGACRKLDQMLTTMENAAR
jgi:hypothetical protein